MCPCNPTCNTISTRFINHPILKNIKMVRIYNYPQSANTTPQNSHIHAPGKSPVQYTPHESNRTVLTIDSNGVILTKAWTSLKGTGTDVGTISPTTKHTPNQSFAYPTNSNPNNIPPLLTPTNTLPDPSRQNL